MEDFKRFIKTLIDDYRLINEIDTEDGGITPQDDFTLNGYMRSLGINITWEEVVSILDAM